jgi:hypothetical protein
VSNSKKTILINRGAEDGLAVGDHAKFFITSGVIARGIVEKVSPSRSVWSLYRIVDPVEVIDGKVLNLKIASPVKITDDPSKSMKDEPIPAGNDKMPINAGENEAVTTPPKSEMEQNELESLGIEEKTLPVKQETPSKPIKNHDSKEVGMLENIPSDDGTGRFKNWELWGIFFVNALSGTVSSSSTTTSTASVGAPASTIDFSIGIERYFLQMDNILKNMSLNIFIHKRSVDIGQDVKVISDWFEYGGSLNYHFLNPPASINKGIGFASLSYGVGSATLKDSYLFNGVSTDTSINETNSFISGGVGAKYILANGFGVKALFDYYRSSESYSDPNNIIVKRTLAGPRIQFGISYRF